MVQCRIFLYIFQYVFKPDWDSQMQEKKKRESIMAVWTYRITDDTGSIKPYMNAKVNQDLASDRSLVLGGQKILVNNISAISNLRVTHLVVPISLCYSSDLTSIFTISTRVVSPGCSI